MAECYGESTYLNTVLGVAAVVGYQGDDLSAPDSIAACAKHFVGYAVAEGGRDYNSTEITTTSLKDVYLPPFEAVCRAGCVTYMTSFNEIGGVPSCANKPLVNDLLRDEWGFDGFVVTDWAAVWELVNHGVAADAADAAQQSLLAGSDMDMCTNCYKDNLVALVAEGTIDEAYVRQAAERIIRVKFQLGLFDQPLTLERTVDRTPHKALAREATARCAILLENDGILPLSSEPAEEQRGRIVVAGPMAAATADLFGTWTLDGVPSEVVSLADALSEQV